MYLSDSERHRLLFKAKTMRERILRMVYESGSGHVGTALGQCDLLVALYYRILRIDPKAPKEPGRDRMILSKGHGGLGLAPILADVGFFPESELDRTGLSGAPVGMHLDHHKIAGIETSTGSLGHGLGFAVGCALSARMQGQSFRTYCLMSDGELYEGSIWEAILCASAYQLGRLIVIIDRNRLTMDGFTEELVPLEPLEAKFRAFGFEVQRTDGHDMDAICKTLESASLGEDRGAPQAVIADTVKGKGVSFMENQARWHYGALDSAMFEQAMESISRMYGR